MPGGKKKKKKNKRVEKINSREGEGKIRRASARRFYASFLETLASPRRNFPKKKKPFPPSSFVTILAIDLTRARIATYEPIAYGDGGWLRECASVLGVLAGTSRIFPGVSPDGFLRARGLARGASVIAGVAR